MLEELLKERDSYTEPVVETAPVEAPATEENVAEVDNTTNEPTQETATEVVQETVDEATSTEVDKPTEETDTPVESEVESEEKEANPFVSDFNFDQLTTPDVDPADPAQEPVAQPLATIDWKSISGDIGLEFESKDDLKSKISELSAKASLADSIGLNNQVVTAYKEGFLTEEEILSGRLLVEYGKGIHDEDVLADYFADYGGDMTPEEVSDAIENMPVYEKNRIIAEYKDSVNRKRNEAISHVSQGVSQKQAEHRRQQEAATQAVSQLHEQLGTILPKIEKIAGTDVPVDDEMRKGVDFLIKNPDAMRRAIYGSGKEPSIEHAAHQMLRLLNFGKISKDLSKRAKNDAVAKVISEASNVNLPDSKGSSVGNVKPLTHNERMKRESDLIRKEFY